MTIKTLKIYIEPASLPLTYELIDYVNNIENESVYSVILFQRLKIDMTNIQNGRTVFIDNVNDRLTLKLDSLAKFILGKPDANIEIHTNIYREYDILYPLMKRIVPETPFKKIKLHLYDDGTGTMLQRMALGQVDETIIKNSMPGRAKLLQQHLTSNDNTRVWEWHYIDNYTWHYFMDTKYYLIQPKNNTTVKNSFVANLHKHTVSMYFDPQNNIKIAMPEVWSHLFNTSNDLLIKLQEHAADEQSVLLLTSNYIDREYKEQYKNSLISNIISLQNSGQLPCASKIVYKGHSENIDLNQEICQILGDNITIIPEGAPMEYFQMVGLLPKNVGGCFSTSMFSLYNKDIKFIFFNGTESDETNKLFLKLNDYYDCFSTERIIYLDEKNASGSISSIKKDNIC